MSLRRSRCSSLSNEQRGGRRTSVKVVAATVAAAVGKGRLYSAEYKARLCDKSPAVTSGTWAYRAYQIRQRARRSLVWRYDEGQFDASAPWSASREQLFVSGERVISRLSILPRPVRSLAIIRSRATEPAHPRPTSRPCAVVLLSRPAEQQTIEGWHNTRSTRFRAMSLL